MSPNVKKIYQRHELAIRCGIDEPRLIKYIEERWIFPGEDSQADEQGYDEEDLARARLVADLQEVFGVNDAAVPIILHLIDQLNVKLISEKKAKTA